MLAAGIMARMRGGPKTNPEAKHPAGPNPAAAPPPVDDSDSDTDSSSESGGGDPDPPHPELIPDPRPNSELIPRGEDVYRFVLAAFGRLDSEAVLDQRGAVKALGQAAFDTFKARGASPRAALAKLASIVDALPNRRLRRHIEAALDGVGDGEERWFG